MSRTDPQATTGGTAGYAPKPKCACGHAANLHAIPKSGAAHAACSTYAYGRWCGCKRYEAANVAPTKPAEQLARPSVEATNVGASGHGRLS